MRGTMSTQSQRASLGGVPDALMQLFDAQMRLGADLFESLTGRPMPSLGDVSRSARETSGLLGLRTTGCAPRGGACAIPPPCWMPQPLGECTSHVSQCRTACVRIVVTNCDRVGRTVTVQAAGAGAKQVTVSPPSLTLGPMERATVSACITVPENAPAGERVETLLWVRGCKEYFLRWTVSVATAGLSSCHEVEVCDCPDYVHHWYDHFYCVRPCPQGRQPVPNPNEPSADNPRPTDPNRPPG
jgi:hypothetical protein